MLSSNCLQNLRECFQFKKRGKEKAFICAPFQTDIKFIFEGFDVELEKCAGFNNNTRSLLVDNILKNMLFNPKSEQKFAFLTGLIKNSNYFQQIEKSSDSNVLSKVTQKLILKNMVLGLDKAGINSSIFPGLPYMLENSYFNEAFILHEESEGNKLLSEIIVHLMHDDTYDTSDYIKELNKSDKIFLDPGYKKSSDIRSKLDDSWANLKNLFKFQPRNKIRDYFGEYIALYFSFTGILISSLWFCSIIGMAFFVLGVINRYTNRFDF